jgi:hypothetical protein
MRQSLFSVVDALRKEIRWVIANLVGMSVPIVFEVWLTMPRSEWDSIGGIDAIVAWTTKVFPFLTVIFIVNAIWLIQIWRSSDRLERRRALGAWLLVCCLWLVPLSLNPVFFGLFGEVIRMISGEAWHH